MLAAVRQKFRQDTALSDWVALLNRSRGLPRRNRRQHDVVKELAGNGVFNRLQVVVVQLVQVVQVLFGRRRRNDGVEETSDV